MSIYDRFTKYLSLIINQPIETINFKSNPSFTYMLEHVSEQLGNEIIKAIRQDVIFKEIIEKHKEYIVELCRLNDSVGNPIKYNFNNFAVCSPSNIRYIFHSFLILRYISENNFNNLNIIEIGGGYGGLCFFIHNLSKLFNIKISSYTIFDLKEPSQLQSKYLNFLNLGNVRCVTISNYEESKISNDSFLISTYSFSEISLKNQNEYTNKILNNHVSHGFIAWNEIPVYEFIENKKIVVEDEVPRSTFKHNCFVKF